ncbi:hypothetical protein ACFOHK_00145 [Falsigemmobacter intermedius]|uniref:Calcium-binding protein n=1 Tax=Falsigemmobacter intermedius TaxID=1553448 RepID=A0A3S3WGS7_9RHOB|nr:hypothetical protein [Falsigemmobacter intermedius]RWY38200.1 hypothetical protein EP867_16560 [Falsigemmobacter intermedius]
MTWNSDSGKTSLTRAESNGDVLTARGDRIGSTAGLTITGAEGLVLRQAGSVLDLSGQQVSAGQAGAEFHAEDGMVKLLAVGDEDRQKVISLETGNVLNFIGTAGDDQAQLIDGAVINLGAGSDRIIGSHANQDWHLVSRNAAGRELSLEVTLSDLDSETGEATARTKKAFVYGADAISGGHGDDRLVIGDQTDSRIEVSSSEEEPILTLRRDGTTGGQAAVTVTGFEALSVADAGAIPNAHSAARIHLDYTGLKAGQDAVNVSIDLTTGSATGLKSVSGVYGVTTGAGDDVVVAAAGTRFIRTHGGDDTISLGLAHGDLLLDGGAGTNTLIGDQGLTCAPSARRSSGLRRL